MRRADGRLWNVAVAGARAEAGYAFTVAPLIVKDKLIVGPGRRRLRRPRLHRGLRSGHRQGSCGASTRFPDRARRDTRRWAGDSWQHGGAAVWVTGSYDPELNLMYWGTGNPGPDFNGDKRGGDNLYSDSVVALDPDTGKLKWHFQFTPHDEFDYDSTQVPVLADIEWQGRPRKVMLWANRNGFWYVLDRATGEFLSGKPFAKVTWTESLDPRGRPMNVVKPTREGTRRLPASRRRDELVLAVVQPAHRAVLRVRLDQTPPRRSRGGRPNTSRADRFLGAFPTAADIEHQRRADQPPAARGRHGRHRCARSEDRREAMGVLDDGHHGCRHPDDRERPAVLRRTRRFLLRARCPYGRRCSGRPRSAASCRPRPMSYAIGNRQYVAIAAGNSLYGYALKQ